MELRAHSISELYLFHIVYILLLIQRTSQRTSLHLNYMAKCGEGEAVGMHTKLRRTRIERKNE